MTSWRKRNQAQFLIHGQRIASVQTIFVGRSVGRIPCDGKGWSDGRSKVRVSEIEIIICGAHLQGFGELCGCFQFSPPDSRDALVAGIDQKIR